MSLDWRNLPALTALRAFDATARHGGFAGAARSLNVTHSAIAQQVRALEAHLGVSLAVRQGRSVALTEAGEQLARTLSEGFDTIAGGIARLKDANASRAFRVTTTPFLTERVIMPRLAEFWAAHPGAEISLSPTRTYADIVGDGFDLALRAILPYQDHGRPGPGLDAELVAQTTIIGIASPKLLESRGTDPNKLPWLWHEVMDLKIKMMTECGIAADKVEQVKVGSANLLLEAVRQGLGVTVFNEAIARDEIAAGGIVELPLPRPGLVDYYALTAKGPRHPLVAPFISWVRSLI